jgi:hypothetical protein
MRVHLDGIELTGEATLGPRGRAFQLRVELLGEEYKYAREGKLVTYLKGSSRKQWTGGSVSFKRLGEEHEWIVDAFHGWRAPHLAPALFSLIDRPADEAVWVEWSMEWPYGME